MIQNAQWNKLLQSGLTLGALILFGFGFQSALVPAADADHLQVQGFSPLHGWKLDIRGVTGQLVQGEETWELEFLRRSLGMGGFLHNYEYLARRPDDFMYAQIMLNRSGSRFWAFLFRYGTGTAEWELFEGEYVAQRKIKAQPSFLEGYKPLAPLPDYHGRAFRVSSTVADIRPEEGTIQHPDLRLQVFPIAEVEVTESWSEFWSFGIDPHTEHTYLLFFYTITPDTTLLDLWDGRIFSLPLGQAVVTGGEIHVARGSQP